LGGETDWLNNAYYSSGWKHFLADEAARIQIENGKIRLNTAIAGVAGGAITWTCLPLYADDAAAKAAGLTEGHLYRTATGVVMTVLAP
jgi:hypothetical protein